ncbi:MAG: hypothetical protein H3C27_18080 [Opitutaceae bacterium]|nr:hypothetical protein [Opitutaceae bacterium]
MLDATKRGHLAWLASQVPPGVTQTSGCEEESLYAVWRVVHSEPNYPKPGSMPYASAYFNWLFYSVYGAIASPVVHRWGDASLPVATRLLTVLGGLAGAIALFIWTWKTQSGNTTLHRAAIGGFVATMVFSGPLMGWWLHTTRPDCWALALETCGTVWLLLNLRQRPWLASLGATACFYLAWSFKVSFILGLTTTLLFLTAERHWRQAVAILVITLTAWAMTLWLGGDNYRHWVLEATGNNRFALDVGWGNLNDAVIKSLPLVILAVAAWISPARSSLARDTKRLVALGLPICVLLTFVGSSKIGAASYYYFSCAALLGIVGATFTWSPRSLGLIIPAGLGLILGIYVVIRPNQLATSDLQARWQVWQHAPEPRFSQDLRLNLPWLNEMTPPFVLAYNYASQRQQGITFEKGGIGGLIQNGYFSALLLFATSGDEYDGTPLIGYRRAHEVGGMTLFLRINESEMELPQS